MGKFTQEGPYLYLALKLGNIMKSVGGGRSQKWLQKVGRHLSMNKDVGLGNGRYLGTDGQGGTREREGMEKVVER